MLKYKTGAFEARVRGVFVRAGRRQDFAGGATRPAPQSGKMVYWMYQIYSTTGIQKW